MEKEKIIYSAIIRKKHTILIEYTDYSGNFSQITKGIMDEVINTIKNEPYKYKAKFFYGKYIFHVLKDLNIYLLTMTKPIKIKNNNDILFYNFLFKIHEDISQKVDFDNPYKMRAYSLGSYLPELKKKVIEFNKGEIKFDTLLTNKQNDINKFELLDEQKFGEYLKLPILSNEQVHDDTNLLPKEGNFNTSGETSETFDSFNEDLLRSKSLLERKKKNREDLRNDSLVEINDIDPSEFEVNLREKKRKKIWPKIVFPILGFLIILILLDMFVFKVVIKI